MIKNKFPVRKVSKTCVFMILDHWLAGQAYQRLEPVGGVYRCVGEKWSHWSRIMEKHVLETFLMGKLFLIIIICIVNTIAARKNTF